MFEDDDDRRYEVVINDEEQYSIWPVKRKIPAGWQTVDCEGSKSECLAYIDKTWTDMRPVSLRRQMET